MLWIVIYETSETSELPRKVIFMMSRSFPALGTMNTITIRERNPEALEQVKKRILELHDRWSVFRPDSEISRINQAAGGKPVAVSGDTIRILREGQKYGALSGGTYDITAQPLTDLWRQAAAGENLPGKAEIRRRRRLVDYRQIMIDETRGTVQLLRTGQAVDPGGIAKGFAADESKRILMEYGVTDAVINLGGTVSVFGKPKKIGIQKPYGGSGSVAAILQGTDCTVVTSGAYEKYFTRQGIRYPHILNVATGRPAESGLTGVTLVGSSGTELDALATGVFVLGLEEGAALVRQQGLEAVFFMENGELYATDGLKDQLTVL
ncbi:FAD:protein FMN transferase [Clostridium sp. SY8519]|uniref:FAD:protein FMN transferase n=1 Tax=Clostridium sp. (strain SY8519) TaxID=1042156 RepID=UPI0006813AEB|nr:FAD:protein FMN transferase [Clostridium sp. SY8519]